MQSLTPGGTSGRIYLMNQQLWRRWQQVSLERLEQDVAPKEVLVIHCCLAVSCHNGSLCHWIKTSQALLNRATTSRPERGTVLVAREHQRYGVDIAALSETRIANEGPLREEGGDYTFFWKGKPQAEDQIHGVGFAIRTALLRSMPVLPVGINEHLMKLRIPFSRIRYFTIISTYTLTLTSLDDAKEQFNEQFDQVIRSNPPSNKLVIFGDFNVRVGRDYSNWEGVLGKINDNGVLLLSKCAEHCLCITNTLFRIADKYRTTEVETLALDSVTAN